MRTDEINACRLDDESTEKNQSAVVHKDDWIGRLLGSGGSVEISAPALMHNTGFHDLSFFIFHFLSYLIHLT